MESLFNAPKQIKVLPDVEVPSPFFVSPLYPKFQFCFRNNDTDPDIGKNYKIIPKFMSIAYNFQFFAGLSPIFIRNKNGLTSTSSHLPQKILCGIIHTITLLGHVLYLIGVYQFIQLHKRPDLIYVIIIQTCQFFYIFFLYKQFWLSQSDLEQFVRLKLPLSKKSEIGFTVFVLMFIFIFFVLLAFTLQDNNHPETWTSFEAFVDSSRPILNKITPLKGLSEEGINIMAVIFTFCDLYWGVAHFAALLSAILFFATFFMVVDATRKEIQDENGFEKKVALYQDMKAKIGIINNVSGPILTVCLIDYLNFYASLLGQLDEFFRISEHTFIIVICVTSCGVVGMITAAESYSKVVNIEKELIAQLDFKTGSDWRPSDLKLFLRNCKGETGLRGWKFFTISYPFLGSAIGVWLTYILVILQFIATPIPTNTCTCNCSYEQTTLNGTA